MYWNYERFELREKTNNECKAEFRFYREDINKLPDQLQLLDESTTYLTLSLLVGLFAWEKAVINLNQNRKKRMSRTLHPMVSVSMFEVILIFHTWTDFSRKNVECLRVYLIQTTTIFLEFVTAFEGLVDKMDGFT